MEKESVL